MKYWIIGDEFLDSEDKKSADAQGYLKELVCCKDCIKKDICADYMFSQQEEGYCAWSGRKEE